MAFAANSPHQVAFFQVDAATGLTTADFTIDIFTFNGDPVDDAVAASFAITEMGSGYYYASYVPDAAGFYFLAFEDGMGTNVADAADIDEANFVLLSQDYPTHGFLKPTLPRPFALQTLPGSPPPAAATTLDQYVLLIFNTSDWNVGRTTTDWAIASTTLDAQGNWQVTPLTVPPGTYHMVIRNNYNVTYVFKPSFQVPQ